VNWGSYSSHAGMQQCTLIGTADGALHISGVSSESILSVLMKAAADKLRTTMGNPETFERACMRLIQSNKDAAAAHCAAECGICELVIKNLDTDRTAEKPALRTQHAGCLVLWWIVSPRCDQTEQCQAARQVAVNAGAIQSVVGAWNTFPQEKDLVDVASQLLKQLVDGNESQRDAALACGAKRQWLA